MGCEARLAFATAGKSDSARLPNNLFRSSGGPAGPPLAKDDQSTVAELQASEWSTTGERSTRKLRAVPTEPNRLACGPCFERRSTIWRAPTAWRHWGSEAVAPTRFNRPDHDGDTNDEARKRRIDGDSTGDGVCAGGRCWRRLRWPRTRRPTTWRSSARRSRRTRSWWSRRT